MSNDTGNDVDSQLDEEDRPFLRDRVYYSAKDGLSIAMYALLNNVKDDETKNAIINQVSDMHACNYTIIQTTTLRKGL